MILPCTPFYISAKTMIRAQTPKKIKHKRKKVKMAILKYYKVESDGKIKRLRRECPTPTCGAGVFVSVYTFGLATVCLYLLSLDVIPPRPSVLWQMRLDVHIPAWFQAPCSVVRGMLCMY